MNSKAKTVGSATSITSLLFQWRSDTYNNWLEYVLCRQNQLNRTMAHMLLSVATRDFSGKREIFTFWRCLNRSYLCDRRWYFPLGATWFFWQWLLILCTACCAAHLQRCLAILHEKQLSNLEISCVHQQIWSARDFRKALVVCCWASHETSWLGRVMPVMSQENGH